VIFHKHHELRNRARVIPHMAQVRPVGDRNIGRTGRAPQIVARAANLAVANPEYSLAPLARPAGKMSNIPN
jgi:hypothetical protein